MINFEKESIDRNLIKHFLTALLFLLTAIVCEAQSENDKLGQITDYLNDLSPTLFSGVILIEKNDSILFENSYGYASVEHKIENRIHTLFNIASITKTLTAVATLQLVDKGLLNLEVPIGKYLHDYPNQAVRDSVTAHQLLTHTSGLNNFLVGDYKDKGKLDLREVSDHLPFFVSKPLLFPPGSNYSYSAAGYVVLGLLIEKLSGSSYHHYIYNNVLVKVGMKNTMVIPIDSIVNNTASGYTSYFGESDHLSKNDSFLGIANPAGFYYSTTKDLLKFTKALQEYRLLSEMLTKKMMSPLVQGYHTNYGYGLSIDDRFDQRIVGHTGGWYGIQCELMHFEKDNITVVILSNVDTDEDYGMNSVSNYIKHILAKKPL